MVFPFTHRKVLAPFLIQVVPVFEKLKKGIITKVKLHNKFHGN